jgi:iron complex outermembrane receptor protein
MTASFRRARLGAALLTSCAFLSAPVLAQDVVLQPDLEVEVDSEEIVVTGIRRSLESAIATKRSAGSIVDAIGAEDVGKFPDENVAESLQRITGVQITRNRGDGQQVTIRGLPPAFTLVQFNGRALPSAISDGAVVNRSFNFSILPSEFIRSLEVHKSAVADMEEGGLSGTVVVKTPRALDIGKRILSLSAQGAWEDNTAKVEPRLSGLYSDLFADGRLGVTLGGAYTRRTRESQDVNFLGFRNDLESLGGGLDLNGDGQIVTTDRVEYGNSLFFDMNSEATERLSGLGSIQYQATDTLQLFVEGLYSRYRHQVEGQTSLIRWVDNRGPTDPSAIEMVPGHVSPRAVKFMSDGVDVRPITRYRDGLGDLLSISAGAQYAAGPWQVQFESAYSRSAQNVNNLGLETSGRFKVGYDSTADDELISSFYGDDDYQASLDPNSFQILTLNGAFQKNSRDEMTSAKIDVDRDFDNSVLNRIEAGFKYTDQTLYADNGRLVLTGAQINTLVGGTLTPSIYGAGTFSAAPFLVVAQPSRGGFLESYDGSAMMPATWLTSDTKAFLDRFTDQQLIDAGGTTGFTNDPSGIIDVAETVYAGYVKADFGTRQDRVSGNIGLRAVLTQQHVGGVSPDLTAITYRPSAGNITIIPAAGAVSIDREYWDYLPSANLRINVNDALVVRLAASRTMSRPALSDISPTATASGTRRTIATGNPDLNPFRSNNLDASIEWYFGDRALISVAAFYKDVVSLIRSDTSSQSLTVTQVNADGSTQPLDLDFQITRPVNGEGVKVKGVELSYQQPFTFLPGWLRHLGFLGNYTYVENSDPTNLTGTSRHNFNLSGYYEDARLSVRLAYTFRDGFLSGSGGAFGDGIRTKAFGVLNSNLTYRITDYMSAVLEGQNILNKAQLTSTLAGVPLSYEDNGRRFLFGIRARF